MSQNNHHFWNQIGIFISEKTNNKFHIVNKKTVHGGCINQAFLLEDNHVTYFVKVNNQSAFDNFQSEMAGLKEIDKTDTISVPKVIGTGIINEKSYLILEALQLDNRGSEGDFAAALAALHKTQNPMFGFHQDNYIGSTKQINSRMSDWLTFFIENRIGYQLDLLQKKYNITSLRKNEKQLKIKIQSLFEGYSPFPSLLHGDLWQGNYSFDRQGVPVIYDPACYYGDHEADLAMLELFGNPGPIFFEAYQQHFPIDDGYKQRKVLYNLYHILNHVNLFGRSYLGQAEMMMEQVIIS